VARPKSGRLIQSPGLCDLLLLEASTSATAGDERGGQRKDLVSDQLAIDQTPDLLSRVFGSVAFLVIVNANASMPSRTPANRSADVTAGIANADFFNR